MANPDEPHFIDEYFKQRRQIFELRGQLISEMIDLERHFDDGIQCYFVNVADPAGKPPPLTAEQFRVWVLGRLNLGQKLEIVEQLITYVGVRTYFRGAITAWRELQAYRNSLAHSAVGLGPQTRPTMPNDEHLADMFANPTSHSITKKGRRKSERIEIDEMTRKIEFLGQATLMALRFWIVMLHAHDAEPRLLERLEEFDAMNEHLPPIR